MAEYELVRGPGISSYLRKGLFRAGCELVPLRKFVGQGRSWWQKAGSARTSKKSNGAGYEQPAVVCTGIHAKGVCRVCTRSSRCDLRWVIVNSRGRARCGPRRQDQLVPQKKKNYGAGYKAGPWRAELARTSKRRVSTGYGLVPGDRINSYHKKKLLMHVLVKGPTRRPKDQR